jgi:hypothetical protein
VTLAKERWARLLAEPDIYRQVALRDEVVAHLSRKEAQALLGVCRDGSTEERYTAMGVLMELARRPGRRFPPSLRRGWARLVAALAREQFPNSPLGVRSFQAWREMDRSAAESYVVDEFRLSSVKAESGFLFVIGQLRAFGSDRAHGKLKKMKRLKLTGRAADERDAALRVFEPPTKKSLAALARKWRADRTGPALERLFSALMNGQPPGAVPVKRVIELLGRPTRRSETDLSFEPGLVIEVDENQRVHSFHFA